MIALIAVAWLGQAVSAAPVAESDPAVLSLDQAVDTALGQSKDLKSALLSLEAAALAPERLDSAYAWTVFSETGVSHDAAPRRSPFEPKTITSIPLSAGVKRLFPTGTYLEVTSSFSYFDAPFPALPFPIPQIESGWNQDASLTATHPLWGGRPHEILGYEQEQLRQEVSAGAARAAEGLDRILGRIHGGFWSWALAEQAFINADEAVKAAEEIQRSVASKSRKGLADKRDTLRAEAAVQQARDQRLAAERAIDRARRALLDVIGAEGKFEKARYDLDAPVSSEPLEEVLDRAFDASLALRALESQKAARKAAISLARAQLRSKLFAVGRFGEQALFPNGSAFDDEIGFVSFLGLRYEKTFGDSDASVRGRQAAIEIRRIDTEIARARERIRTAAAEQQSAIRSARAREEAARELVRIQEARYREEQRNFAIGRAFLRDVIEARQQVTAARFMLDAARVSLRMAASERDLLTGELTGTWRRELARNNPAYRAALPTPSSPQEPQP